MRWCALSYRARDLDYLSDSRTHVQVLSSCECACVSSSPSKSRCQSGVCGGCLSLLKRSGLPATSDVWHGILCYLLSGACGRGASAWGLRPFSPSDVFIIFSVFAVVRPTWDVRRRSTVDRRPDAGLRCSLRCEVTHTDRRRVSDLFWTSTPVKKLTPASRYALWGIFRSAECRISKMGHWGQRWSCILGPGSCI